MAWARGRQGAALGGLSLLLAGAIGGCGRTGGDGGQATGGVGGVTGTGTGGVVSAAGGAGGAGTTGTGGGSSMASGGTTGAGGATAGIGGAGGSATGGAGAGGAPSSAALAVVPAVGLINAITIVNDVVYVAGLLSGDPWGGALAKGGGVSALDATTFTAKTGWVASVPPFGNTLVVNDGVVYAGLDVGVGNILALEATTGVPVTTFPDASAPVISMALGANGTLYLGGIFDSVAGVTRHQLATINAATGTVGTWAPEDMPQTSGWPISMAVNGNTVYLAGTFTLVNGGGTWKNLAAVDAATGVAAAWNPAPSASVNRVVISGGTIFVAGSFTTIAGQPRNRLAAFELATGNLTAWDPNADGIVRALAVNGNNVYVGGAFARVGGQLREGLAAVDAATGAVNSWHPIVDPTPVEGASPAHLSALGVSDRLVVAGVAGRSGLRSGESGAVIFYAAP